MLLFAWPAVLNAAHERLRWRAPLANAAETVGPDSRSDDSGGGNAMQYTRGSAGGAVMQARQPVAKQFMHFLDTHLYPPPPPPKRQVGKNPASLLPPSLAAVKATPGAAAAADPMIPGIHEHPKPLDRSSARCMDLASRGYSVEMYRPDGRGEKRCLGRT